MLAHLIAASLLLTSSHLNQGKDFSSPVLIAAHLEQMELELRTHAPPGLSPEQRASRNQLLDRLHGYWKRGVFPHNHNREPSSPVFIDEHGTACAVGQLIIDSGHADLAQRVRAADNLGYVLELQVPGLAEWVAQSGFTAEEFARIQPTYDYVCNRTESDEACRANREESQRDAQLKRTGQALLGSPGGLAILALAALLGIGGAVLLLTRARGADRWPFLSSAPHHGPVAVDAGRVGRASATRRASAGCC